MKLRGGENLQEIKKGSCTSQGWSKSSVTHVAVSVRCICHRRLKTTLHGVLEINKTPGLFIPSHPPLCRWRGKGDRSHEKTQENRPHREKRTRIWCDDCRIERNTNFLGSICSEIARCANRIESESIFHYKRQFREVRGARIPATTR